MFSKDEKNLWPYNLLEGGMGEIEGAHLKIREINNLFTI